LALMHDAELHRTTDGSGPVIAYSLASLEQLDAGSWFAASFAGEYVPGFEEALALCTELGLSVHVEGKSDDSHAVATAQAMARVLETVPHHDVVLSSMTPGVMVECAKLMPDMPRALGLEDACDDWAERTLALGCSAVHMDHEFMDEALLADIAEHRGDLIVRAYTVNVPERAEELYAHGVDAIFTDDPGRLLAPAGSVSRSGTRDRKHPPAA